MNICKTKSLMTFYKDLGWGGGGGGGYSAIAEDGRRGIGIIGIVHCMYSICVNVHLHCKTEDTSLFMSVVVFKCICISMHINAQHLYFHDEGIGCREEGAEVMEMF